MRVHLQARRATTLALAGALTLAGCSTGTPSAVPTAGTPVVTQAPETAAPPTAAPPSETAAKIIEDAGLETIMPAGTYTSRLFQPGLTFELGEGWFRRDAGSERTLNIRRGQDGGEDLTFIAGIDFVQCGKGDVIEPPESSTVVDEIFGMQKLDASQPAEIQVGDLTGTEVRLAGGAPLPDGAEYLDYGCVLSLGDVPYPGDSGWVPITRDMTAQLVVVQVGDVIVLIRARPGAGDVEALWRLTTEVINSAQLG